MKRVLLIVVSLLMLFSLASCSSGGTKSNASFTITDNDGNTVTLTSEDLKNEYSNNAASFVNKYKSASFSFTGTVTEIEGTYKDSLFMEEAIIFEEGVRLEIKDGSHDDIINSISVGDKLYVESEFQAAVYKGDTILLQDVSMSGGSSSWEDKSVLRTVD